MVRISISIPEDLKKRLEEDSSKQDRSVSYVAKEILQEYYSNKDKEK